MPNPMDSLIALILKNSRNGITVFGKLFVQDFPTDQKGFFWLNRTSMFCKIQIFQLLPSASKLRTYYYL